MIAGNAVLLTMYAIVLVLMCKGTRYKLFMTIIILLMIAATLSILNSVSIVEYEKVVSQDGDIMPWGSMIAFASFGGSCCYGVSSWLFAFEYFSIAKTMPLALKGLKLSAAT